MRHPPLRLIALSLLAVASVMGCSGGGDDDTAQAAGGDEEAGRAETTADASDAAASAGAADSSQGGEELDPLPPGEPLSAGRAVIATADLTVVVGDVEDATGRAVDAASRAGGYLANQEARLRDRQVSLTLRVPTDRYAGAVAAVGELGEVVERRVDTEDVTEQVVDLEGRIASGRVSVERVRDLLGQSGDVVQLATVEGELARREADLESLLGQQRVLEDRVALATIHVELREQVAEPDDGDPAGFLGGLRTGWDAFVSAAVVALTAMGFVLPFLVPLALAVLAGQLLRQRLRPTRSGATTD